MRSTESPARVPAVVRPGSSTASSDAIGELGAASAEQDVRRLDVGVRDARLVERVRSEGSVRDGLHHVAATDRLRRRVERGAGDVLGDHRHRAIDPHDVEGPSEVGRHHRRERSQVLGHTDEFGLGDLAVEHLDDDVLVAHAEAERRLGEKRLAVGPFPQPPHQEVVAEPRHVSLPRPPADW